MIAVCVYVSCVGKYTKKEASVEEYFRVIKMGRGIFTMSSTELTNGM